MGFVPALSENLRYFEAKLFAARTEPYELWQGSGIGGPEPPYKLSRGDGRNMRLTNGVNRQITEDGRTKLMAYLAGNEGV